MLHQIQDINSTETAYNSVCHLLFGYSHLYSTQKGITKDQDVGFPCGIK